ncbi:diaminobutyrate--2-oxoglutarate transaminase [Agarilytica rhodophyticola]|uniref:diaminobutyrate--2-oxoglutarate transaminase n=1 Tax=Agarilytica rhodophyticola TaxID=1737490 RepID=UPI000B344162|nr:diaminobutyrate--2-oxoglutarate transaminase [Agarilytica rhodophyticola]
MHSCLQDDLNSKTLQASPFTLKKFSEQAAISLSYTNYLERQNLLESNARSYPRRIPIAIKRAQGIYIEDTKGQLFIDCLAGAGTLALGHNHPVIHNVLKNYLDSSGPLHTLDITTPTKDTFIKDVFDILPAEFAQKAHIQFCGPSGADATEAAIKLAKTATGRRSVLAFSGGYHGMTHGALSLTGNLAAKTPVSNLMPEVHFLPYPYEFRCPFGLKGEQSIASNLHYIENLLSDPESGITTPAAIIVEAVQGEGGMIPAPARWLKGLREITARFDIPLILDEIQCGIGRTGDMFAFEYADIVPDMILLSKAIGGGLPLSLVLFDKSLDKWNPGAHAGTFRGNQMAMAAGSATLDVIRTEQLCQNASLMGERLRQHLQEIQRQYSHIGDVRGRGLMIGVEIVNPEKLLNDGSPTPSGELAAKIQRECLKKGLILELGGRNGCTVRFLPPLIIKPEEIDRVAEIFAQATQVALENT